MKRIRELKLIDANNLLSKILNIYINTSLPNVCDWGEKLMVFCMMPNMLYFCEQALKMRHACEMMKEMRFENYQFKNNTVLFDLDFDATDLLLENPLRQVRDIFRGSSDIGINPDALGSGGVFPRRVGGSCTRPSSWLGCGRFLFGVTSHFPLSGHCM